MVDGVESSSEVQEDDDGEMAGVCREEDVVGDFQEGCFNAVFGTETGLKWFERVIRAEVGFELCGNSTLQHF